MNTLSYVGAAASVGSGLTLTEWGIVIGILTALLTFVANIVYQVRKDNREKRLNDLEVQMLLRHGTKNPPAEACATEE
ncbi:MAG: holin [Pseudomonadaceae bacterium]|nr:holin [Pseudomonadaceae bacterium]